MLILIPGHNEVISDFKVMSDSNHGMDNQLVDL